MDAATLLCLPSRAEGLGRVVLEAMCRARSVVGGGRAGIRDLVTDGVNGLLVDPDDAGDARRRSRGVLGDPERRSASAAPRARTGEEWSVTAEQYAGASSRSSGTCSAATPRARLAACASRSSSC